MKLELANKSSSKILQKKTSLKLKNPNNEHRLIKPLSDPMGADSLQSRLTSVESIAPLHVTDSIMFFPSLENSELKSSLESDCFWSSKDNKISLLCYKQSYWKLVDIEQYDNKSFSNITKNYLTRGEVTAKQEEPNKQREMKACKNLETVVNLLITFMKIDHWEQIRNLYQLIQEKGKMKRTEAEDICLGIIYATLGKNHGDCYLSCINKLREEAIRCIAEGLINYYYLHSKVKMSHDLRDTDHALKVLYTSLGHGYKNAFSENKAKEVSSEGKFPNTDSQKSSKVSLSESLQLKDSNKNICHRKAHQNFHHTWYNVKSTEKIHSERALRPQKTIYQNQRLKQPADQASRVLKKQPEKTIKKLSTKELKEQMQKSDKLETLMKEYQRRKNVQSLLTHENIDKLSMLVWLGVSKFKEIKEDCINNYSVGSSDSYKPKLWPKPIYNEEVNTQLFEGIIQPKRYSAKRAEKIKHVFKTCINNFIFEKKFKNKGCKGCKSNTRIDSFKEDDKNPNQKSKTAVLNQVKNLSPVCIKRKRVHIQKKKFRKPKNNTTTILNQRLSETLQSCNNQPLEGNKEEAVKSSSDTEELEFFLAEENFELFEEKRNEMEYAVLDVSS